MITLKQYNGSEITPADDATLYKGLLNGQNGIFSGCEVTVTSGNTLTVTDGRGVIEGRVFEVGQESVTAAVSGGASTPGRLLVRIDLANDEQPIELDTQAGSPLPALVQQDINAGGSIFEMELASYTVSSSGITGLKRTVNTIQSGWFGQPNATAVKNGGFIDISANTDVTSVTFYAPSDFDRADQYRLNGIVLTVTDLNGYALDYAWKSGAPVTFYIKGNQAFFRTGGGYNETLPKNPTISGRRQSGNIAMTIQRQSEAAAPALNGALLVYGDHQPEDIFDGTVMELSKWTLTGSGAYTFTIPYEKTVDFWCRIFAFNEKRQYQTMEEDSIIHVTPIDFILPRYTGEYEIFGDESSGRIELLSSGSLTLDKGTYDFFLVGGGGAGANCAVVAGRGGSGGGGGYTTTVPRVTVAAEQTWTAVIGAGGAEQAWSSTADGYSGGATSLSYGSSNYTAAGGEGGTNKSSSKGKGGSGGGAGTTTGDAGAGGSDGSNGGAGVYGYSAGTGQGSTTRAFGEPGGTLYAGGGGGGGGYGSNRGEAAGGAGGGAWTYGNGEANTGGGGGGGNAPWVNDNQEDGNPGGGGGSGIIIVRWENAF